MSVVYSPVIPRFSFSVETRLIKASFTLCSHGKPPFHPEPHAAPGKANPAAGPGGSLPTLGAASGQQHMRTPWAFRKSVCIMHIYIKTT